MNLAVVTLMGYSTITVRPLFRVTSLEEGRPTTNPIELLHGRINHVPVA